MNEQEQDNMARLEEARQGSAAKKIRETGRIARNVAGRAGNIKKGARKVLADLSLSSQLEPLDFVFGIATPVGTRCFL